MSFTDGPRRYPLYSPANLNAPVACQIKGRRRTNRPAGGPTMPSVPSGRARKPIPNPQPHASRCMAHFRACRIDSTIPGIAPPSRGRRQCNPQKKPPDEHEVRLAARPCLFRHLRNATSFRTRKLFNCNRCLPHKQAYDKNKLRNSRRTRQRVLSKYLFRFAGLPGHLLFQIGLVKKGSMRGT